MTTTTLLVLAVLVPALLAPLVALPAGLGAAARGLAPWGALPALAFAALPLDYPATEVSWLLLGSHFHLDGTGRIFLLAAAALWAAAGIFARDYVPRQEQGRFYFFYLATMAGNLGLPVAGDAGSFYLFFALMTFAGYGLVVHSGSREAGRAGRIYLVMAVIGEAFLLAGLLVAAQSAGTIVITGIPAGIAEGSRASLVTVCLLIGFGIKAGAVPLHVWLPLAHPVAPTPASAVLSGSMIKAGVLGWLRFLPLGEMGLVGWGTLLIALGIGAAFFGVIIGVVQTDPKTVLAYSSISQMGLINVAIGIALTTPDAHLPAVAAVVAYALHHGLAKGALFLGVGVASARPGSGVQRAFVAAGLVLPALAIAGAPLTSGAVAKGQLSALLHLSPGRWPEWLEWLLPISAFATTLLMARFLVLIRGAARGDPHRLSRRLWVPWSALLIAVAFATGALPRWYPLEGVEPYVPGIAALDILPMVAALLLVWLILARRGWPAPDAGRARVAPGDLVNPIERLLAALPRPTILGRDIDPVSVIAAQWYQLYAYSDRQDLLLRIELAFTRWTAAILLLLLVTAACLILLARG